MNMVFSALFMQQKPAFSEVDKRSIKNCRKPCRRPSDRPKSSGLADSIRCKSVLKSVLEDFDVQDNNEDDAISHSLSSSKVSLKWDRNASKKESNSQQCNETQPALIHANSSSTKCSLDSSFLHNCRKPCRRPSDQQKSMDIADSLRLKRILDGFVEKIEDFDPDDDEVVSVYPGLSKNSLKSKQKESKNNDDADDFAPSTHFMQVMQSDFMKAVSFRSKNSLGSPSVKNCKKPCRRPSDDKYRMSSTEVVSIPHRQSLLDALIDNEVVLEEKIDGAADNFASPTPFMQPQPVFFEAASIESMHCSGYSSIKNCRKPRRRPSDKPNPMILTDSLRRKSVLDAVIDAKVVIGVFDQDVDGVFPDDPGPRKCPLKSDPDRRKKKGHVAFGDVLVHTHAFELGDNPSVKHGIPLTIGWDALSSEEFSLDDFEARGGRTPLKVISPKNRERIAKRRGHSRESIIRVHNELTNFKKNPR